MILREFIIGMQQIELIGYVRMKDIIRVINPIDSIQRFLNQYCDCDELIVKIKGTNEIIFQSQEGIEQLSKLSQYGFNAAFDGNAYDSVYPEEVSRFKVKEAENTYYTLQYDDLNHVNYPKRNDELNLMTIVRKVGDIRILMKNHKIPICFKVKDSHQILHSFNPLNYTAINEKNETVCLNPRLPLEFRGVQKQGIIFNILEDINSN